MCLANLSGAPGFSTCGRIIIQLPDDPAAHLVRVSYHPSEGMYVSAKLIKQEAWQELLLKLAESGGAQAAAASAVFLVAGANSNAHI